ncbi:MAG: hypothetical protein FJ271_02920 [Planctomycetes bacterium]|nr:hypothetical protein [Planctomycetota bacterium]
MNRRFGLCALILGSASLLAVLAADAGADGKKGKGAQAKAKAKGKGKGTGQGPQAFGLAIRDLQEARIWLAEGKPMFVVAVVVAARADERARDDIKDNPDKFADFSKVIHGMVVKQMPKVYEDKSAWGQTIPLKEPLRLPNLRTYVKKGNKVELPHGLWRKVRVRMDDPQRDLKIKVRDFKAIDAKTYRVVVDSESAVRTEIEAQHWQKGLTLVGFKGKADCVVAVSLDCDVSIALDPKTFALKVDPKVTRLNLDLKDFTLREVGTVRLGQVLEGEQAKAFGDQFKDLLQTAVKASEPRVKDYANKTIAKSIEEGKGTLGGAGLLKFLGNAPKDK